MKIVYASDKKPGLLDIKTDDIPIGQVFKCSGLSTDAKVFLRTYDGFVSIDDPSETWNDNPAIHDYQPLKAELHIFGEEL